MVASTDLVLFIAWSVAACAAGIGQEIGNRDVRLVRRETHKRRKVGIIDTVVAQVQPQGNVLSPERTDYNGDGDLDETATAHVVSPSGLEEINGDWKKQKPVTKRVSESIASKTALGPWVHAALASWKKKKTKDDAVIVKRNRLMRMVAHADGDTEKIGKPNEEDLAELDDVERPPVFPNAHSGKVTIEHKFRGCFPLADEKDLSAEFHDFTCMKSFEGEIPCRGGLPFFRLSMAAGQSYLDCFTFCLSKGMDLSGIVNLEKNKECRCGATVMNVGVWRRQQPNKQLLLPSKKLQADDPNCKLLVWEYTGGLTEDDSVPYPLLQISDDDRTYMESIAVGHDVTQEEGEDNDTSMNITDINITIDDDGGQPNASLLKMSGICMDDPTVPCKKYPHHCHKTYPVAVKFTRECPLTCGTCTKNGSFVKCYPHNCAGGGGPWLTKRSDGKVYIPYFFENNVNKMRKDGFKKAVEEFHQNTCIRWVESASDVSPPRVSVGVIDPSSCSANVGYPGPTGTNQVNMGWCNHPNDVGSIVHELGHVVGMKHEQNRIDGSSRAMIDGQWRGPHIQMHWENVPSDWKPQYVPLADSYVGSAKDGSYETHWGYEPYDFESVMHYPRRARFTKEPARFDTIPSIYNSVVGDRSNLLSSGDIRQLSDMYQCGAPTPPPPTPPPGPCQWWCWYLFSGCWWHQMCRGCDHCGSSLFVKRATQGNTLSDDDSSLFGASEHDSVDKEDLEENIAVWVADAWGTCKKGRVICTRSRQVVCESPRGKELNQIKCDLSQKPPSKQACYCSEITEVPEACVRNDSSFGGKPCKEWRGLDCLGIDSTGGLQASCPHICGLC